MDLKPFTVLADGRRVTAYRHDKKLPRVKIAAFARQWRSAQ